MNTGSRSGGGQTPGRAPQPAVAPPATLATDNAEIRELRRQVAEIKQQINNMSGLTDLQKFNLIENSTQIKALNDQILLLLQQQQGGGGILQQILQNQKDMKIDQK